MFDLTYDQKKRTDDPGNLTPITFSAIVLQNNGPDTSFTITWTTNVACSTSLIYQRQGTLVITQTSETDTDVPVTSQSVTIAVPPLILNKYYYWTAYGRYANGKDGLNRTVMNGYVFTSTPTLIIAASLG